MNWLQPHYNKKPPMEVKNKNTVASSDPKTHSPQENIWFALRATKEKRAHSRSISEKSLVLEHFYRNARIYFSKTQQIRTDVSWKKEDNLRNKPRRLPAKGWPAPPALTFTDFLNFPPPNFFFSIEKSQVCRVGCAKAQKRRGLERRSRCLRHLTSYIGVCTHSPYRLDIRDRPAL